jgi:lysyl-tRNA synthetase class 2
MSHAHLQHISKNKEFLEKRSDIIKNIRLFFWSKNFKEVETPNIVALPGQEPYLYPIGLYVCNEKNKKHKAYLHTSPEYTMKKMLASGFTNIFSICKCFRNNESFGGNHNPEFTMLEWYRVNTDFYKIMDDVEDLFKYISKDIKSFEFKKFKRIHMRDLWKEYVGVNLDNYLEREKMFELCKAKNYNPETDESYEDLFYRIFLNKIEPKLIEPTIVHHYPALMSALAKLSSKDTNYAERFEVYINGIELANAFSELTSKEEQLKRLKEEQELRTKLGKEVYDIDMDFVESLEFMPECAGIALGIDRFVQILLGCQNIDGVLVLPMSKFFASQKE